MPDSDRSDRKSTRKAPSAESPREDRAGTATPGEVSSDEQAAAPGASPAAASPEAAGVEMDLQDQVLAERNRALRAQAELENYRKRARREMEEERRYAAAPLIRDLLVVVDNLQRAIEAAQQHENSAGLLEGVKMVAAQIQSVFEQHHCRPIEASGAPFDPNRHEAIAQQPSDEVPAGTVAHVAQIGYQLHDRVIRPPQVIVSTGPADSPSPKTAPE